MKTRSVRLLALAASCGAFLAAQTADDTLAKQVIIFGRHAVRTPNSPNSTLNNFSALSYPGFGFLGPSVITPNGQTNEMLLGGYFRLWLTQQGLLTGNDAADAPFVYVRAEDAPLMVNTAQAFAAGLLPSASVNINSYTNPAPDPIFDPIDAGVAQLDEQMAVAAVNGRLGGNPQSLATAYAAEIALTRSVLFNYPVSQTPPPAAPAGKLDVAAAPISVSAGTSAQLPVNLGGLQGIDLAIDPFIMEYADGMPLSEVGWGQLDAGAISQIFRLYDVTLDLNFKTPYLARVQSSNLASHIVRSLVQAATGNAVSGTLGNPQSKVLVVIGTNTNVVGLAGLFHFDWLVPTYQPDDAAPGGAIVFQPRQSQSTGEFVVRVSYIAQTMDQLRNQTVLSLKTPPAMVPVFVPGCSQDNATFDCTIGDFMRVAKDVIDPNSADTVN